MTWISHFPILNMGAKLWALFQKSVYKLCSENNSIELRIGGDCSNERPREEGVSWCCLLAEA
jgi:hypothetical protein